MTEKVSLANQSPASQEKQPGEQGYVPPVDSVPLPSKGKVYPEDSVLCGAESVEIRSMTGRDEDILTSRALLKSGKAISTLIKSCVINKSIDPESMITGDRNALLVAIRITGYGQSYRVDVQCPKCDETVKHEFDLSKLPIKPLDISPVVPSTNEFSFALPMSKKEVTFKLMTGNDDRELSLSAERTKKAGLPESPVTSRLSHQILSIGQERDRGKISQLVKNMPAGDTRALRAYIEKIDPGIDMTATFCCPSCEQETEVDVPLGTEFFWPSG